MTGGDERDSQPTPKGPLEVKGDKFNISLAGMVMGLHPRLFSLPEAGLE